MGTKISEEQREARRELAKKLHSEVIVDPITGEERRKFGGPQPGSGRPRKKRATEIVAEEAAKNADLITAAFRDALHERQPATTRLAAARDWLSVEQREIDREERETRELENLSQQELLEGVTAVLIGLAKGSGRAGAGSADTRGTDDIVVEASEGRAALPGPPPS